MRHISLGLLLILMARTWTSCSNSGSGPAKGPEISASSAGEAKADEDLSISSNFSTFTYSLGNNPLTSKTVNAAKAKEFADELEAKLNQPSAKDRKDLIALMASKRLSGQGIGSVFQVAKKLMVVEMKEDIRREMPEVAQLELALASLHSRQFSMAEHWIEKLMDSKNEKTKAAALTAKGMIAQLDNRLPEAVALWNEAIKIRSDYEPARLNIGFTALRFGDFRTAKAMLAGMDADWFVQTGQMQAERLADSPKEAAELCNSIFAKRKSYKPAMFSCALNDYQGLNNPAKARIELEQIAKTEGGPTTIDEKAYLTIGRIEKETREQQAKERANAAAAAAAAKAQQAQQAPQAQPGAPAQQPPAGKPAGTAPAQQPPAPGTAPANPPQ